MKQELIDDILNPEFNFEDSLYEDTSEDIKTTCLYCGRREKETAVPSSFLKN